MRILIRRPINILRYYDNPTVPKTNKGMEILSQTMTSQDTQHTIYTVIVISASS
jgi:hypothetical protein